MEKETKDIKVPKCGDRVFYKMNEKSWKPAIVDSARVGEGKVKVDLVYFSPGHSGFIYGKMGADFGTTKGCWNHEIPE